MEVADDGSVLVTKTVSDILTALADDLAATVRKVVEQVAAQRGDYLAAVANLDDYAAQMMLLADGRWGAGTTLDSR